MCSLASLSAHEASSRTNVVCVCVCVCVCVRACVCVCDEFCYIQTCFYVNKQLLGCNVLTSLPFILPPTYWLALVSFPDSVVGVAWEWDWQGPSVCSLGGCKFLHMETVASGIACTPYLQTAVCGKRVLQKQSSVSLLVKRCRTYTETKWSNLQLQ